MKVKKKYLALGSGYIRVKKIEVNWGVYEWALPLSISYNETGLMFVRMFCVEIIFRTNFKNI